MSNMDKVLGDKVKILRNRRGWNQNGLALKMGMTQSDISKIEGGSIRGGRDTVELLSKALEVSFDSLVRNTSFATLSDPAPLLERISDRSQPIIAYFASALTGLNPEQIAEIKALDEEINRICSAYERYNVVLYRPRLKTSPTDNPDVSPREVYEIDRERVAASDVVFLAALYPSLGAGMEIQIAQQSCTSIVILKHASQKPLSRMVLGCPARIEIVNYSSLADLEEKVLAALNQVLPAIAQFHTNKMDHDSTRDFDLGKRIRQLREQRNFSVDMLARIIGVGEAYIESLETKSEIIVNPSLDIVRRISRALLVSESFLISGHQSLDDRSIGDSESLRAVARETDMSVRDFEFLWGEHTEIYKNDLSMIGMDNRTDVGTERYWKDRYEELKKRKSGNGQLFS